MAKDDREILHGIRFPIEHEGRKKSRLFKSGMEDELAAAATDEQLKLWVEAGYITGTWRSTSKKAAKEEVRK